MKNFWQELKSPFFILAPMDDVTDDVFRQVVGSCAKPDVYFTEFTNVDGLNSKGKEKLMPRLQFEKSQHPIVAQIWGKKPENYFKVAQMLKEMGFDGIDINMGCPEKNVVRNGNCSGLIREPERAREIILATIEGAGGLPVSVKTRIGLDTIITEEWIGFLLGFDLAAITVHGRTAKEMSKVPAHWDEIAKAVQLRDKQQETSNKRPVIIGNGDVLTYQDGLDKVKEFGVDGVMIGRGIFHNPFVFDPKGKKIQDLGIQDRLELLLRHARLFDKIWGDTKNFNILKKFFKIYVSDFDEASELRVKLMETHNLADVEKIVSDFTR